MSERIDETWTRQVAYRIGSARLNDAFVLDKIAANEEHAPTVLRDCTPERLAADAIRARQEWAWATFAFLRWLLAEWPGKGAA